ncbi:UDP-glucuronic acid decarboxylase 2-like [Gossypium arboreum]|uniref:UDP-glucuronic acid decarboxylase 2-like n=1 Tax=Gossypium arboreum TaxID=29729 RepID=UPI000818FBD3|nr:UDP-glucuronic acid decarboxylase 2-like [Gossypium arboreum]
MASELIHRNQTTPQSSPNISPGTPSSPVRNWKTPFRYVAQKQRFFFVLVGIAIAALFFNSFPVSTSSLFQELSGGGGGGSGLIAGSVSGLGAESSEVTRRVLYEAYTEGFRGRNVAATGKVPLGLKKKNLRIVVTGGAGFVGSHLVDRLIARGDSVIVVDNFFTGRKENLMHHFGNPKFELIRHDVVEPILLEVDQIYHLACPASPVHYKFNPVKTIKTNVVGTLNMLGLAKRVGARFLLTSTSEVYGDPLQHPQVETYWGNVNPIGVRSCYDEGKRTAETLTMDYHRSLGIEVRIARIFNTYGPRMCIDDGRVVSNFVAQALRKEPMTVYGDGKQTRSFQYVSDLVEGLIRLMEGDHVGPFNLGNPGEFTMLELAEVVQEAIDPNAKIEFRPNTEDDPHKRKPDISKAKQLLGWEPTISLRKGLPLMVSDFRQRIFGTPKTLIGGGATA